MAKRKIRVGIDVDGVLRDFDTKAMEIIKRLYPDKVLSDIKEYLTSQGYNPEVLKVVS